MLGRLIRALFRSQAGSERGVDKALAQTGALLAHGKITEARAIALRALEHEPESAAAQLVIGRCEMLEGRWPEANRALSRVLEVDPRNVDAMLELGAVRRALGDQAEAVRLGRQALARSPDSVAAGQLLAELLLPGEHYLVILEKIHRHLRPATYVEVGVFEGQSLALVNPDTSAVGIDPQPRLTARPPLNVQISRCGRCLRRAANARQTSPVQNSVRRSRSATLASTG